MMTELEKELRSKVRELLESGELSCVIGYRSTRNPLVAGPAFIRKPEDADTLVWNPMCRGSLAKYLLDFKNQPGRTGILVKGCDSRSVVRLLNDNQIDRGKVFIISLPCPGIVREDIFPELPRKTALSWDAPDGGLSFMLPTGTLEVTRADALEGRCLECPYPRAVAADLYLGGFAETPKEKVAWEAMFADVAAIEALTPEGKQAFWKAQFEKCIRCYACRNSCPACSCRECCFESPDVKWLGKGTSQEENEVFHLTRAFHVAGRCTGCGECVNACPVGIPIHLLNKKVAKDMAELFGTAAPGTDTAEDIPFRTFSMDDPEEFM